MASDLDLDQADDNESAAAEVWDAPGSEISLERRRDQQAQQQREMAYAVALRALARREHSTKELHQKLRHRGVTRPVADEILSSLREDGLQSDERFTEIFVRSRIERGQGELRIRADLRNKGIDEELAGRFFPRDEDHWQTSATDILARRFDRTARTIFDRFHDDDDEREASVSLEKSDRASPSFFEERRRLNARMGRFLASRGFAAWVVRRAIDDLWREVEHQ